MTNLTELRLLASAVSVLERQLADSDTVSDQIDCLERLRTMQYCLLVSVNKLLDRRQPTN